MNSEYAEQYEQELQYTTADWLALATWPFNSNPS